MKKETKNYIIGKDTYVTMFYFEKEKAWYLNIVFLKKNKEKKPIIISSINKKCNNKKEAKDILKSMNAKEV